MIIARINGGLGNQMFQYAFARSLALRHRVPVMLDLRDYAEDTPHKFSLQHFNIEANVASNTDLELFEKPEWKKENIFQKWRRKRTAPVRIKQDDFGYDPAVAERSGPYTYLDGYWQSEQYFSEIRKDLLLDFQLTQPMSSRSQELMKIMKNENSVSIHIRRGDYVNDPATNEFHGTCSPEYYAAAINRMEQKQKGSAYFIFSDDVNWVRDNFSAPGNVTYIDHTDAATNYEDMMLMASCKHHIIANSTFSWWGAWLNPIPDKMVIAPKRWFNKAALNSEDIIPKSWMQL